LAGVNDSRPDVPDSICQRGSGGPSGTGADISGDASQRNHQRVDHQPGGGCRRFREFSSRLGLFQVVEELRAAPWNCRGRGRRGLRIGSGENTPYHWPGSKRIVMGVIIAQRRDSLMGLTRSYVGTQCCPTCPDKAGRAGRRRGGLIPAGKIMAGRRSGK
jgi:hypothetical protein